MSDIPGTHFAGPIKLGAKSMPIAADVHGLSAAKTLTADESNGMNYILDNAGGLAFTLPAPTQGWTCRFTIGSTFASTDYVFTAETAGQFQGSVIAVGAIVDIAAADTLTLAASAENVGDFIDFWSDGTSIFVFGNFLVTGALVAA